MITPAYLEVLKKNNIKLSVHAAKQLEDRPELLRPHKKEPRTSFFTPDASVFNFQTVLAVPIKRLGKGGFGVVRQCISSENQEFVALKRIWLSTDFVEEDFWAEIEVLKILGRYRGHGIRTMYSGEKGYILMDFHEGKKLSDYERGSFSPIQALHVLLGILSDMRQLHEHKTPYLHNDISADNVMISMKNPNEPVAKLIDFGASRQNNCISLTERDGHMAPELTDVSNDKRTFATDIFSFGRTAVTLLEWTTVTGGYQELEKMVWRCMLHDPGARPSLETIIEGMTKLREDLINAIPKEREKGERCSMM